MQCKVNTKDLKDVLALHKKIVTKKQSYNYTFILTGVKLKTDNDSLEVITTNLEQSLKTKIESEIVADGEVLLPFTVFENTVKACDTETIEIETIEEIKTRTKIVTIKESYQDPKTNEWISPVTEEKDVEYTEVKCKVDKMLINAMDLEEYPKFPELKDGKVIENLPFEELITSISKIIKTVSTDESRVILTGIYFDTANNQLVGTDSYILGVKKYQFHTDIGQFNLPGKCFPILKDILKQYKVEKFDLAVTESDTHFTIGKHIFVSRNLTGKYPDYQQLIPADFDMQVNLNCKNLIKVLDKSSKIIKDTTPQGSVIPVKFLFGKNHLEIVKTDREIGTYKDNMAIETIKGKLIYEIQKDGKPIIKAKSIIQAQNYITEHFDDPENYNIIEKPGELLMAFNPHFLKKALENFETVNLFFKDELRPIAVKNDDSLLYVVMPIRIT